ncbi:MAG: helix-turn-helix domain-containing protein [Streptosporangiaceae bacterium]
MADSYGKQLGTRLRAVREALKLDRDEASARTGGKVPPVMLKHWEYGTRQMNADQLAILGAAYGVAAADLVPR